MSIVLLSIGAIASLVLLVPPASQAQAQAQTPPAEQAAGQPQEKAVLAPPAPSAWDTFSDHFQIRKAFDGGKGESEAAAIGLISPGNGSATYWLVDAGIRTTPFDFLLNKKGDLEFTGFPSAEWHHMSAEPLLNQSAINKAGGSLTAELWFPGFTKLQLREHIVSKGSVQQNFINHATEQSVSVALETCAAGVETHTDGYWEGGVRPCAELTYNGARRLHYYPYVGLEYYDKLAMQSHGATPAPAFDGSFFLVRFQGDAYPFNTADKAKEISGLVLNFEYAYRRSLEEHTGLDARNFNMLSLGATFFFVKGQSVGVGLTADIGRSPAVNFVSERRVVLALRIMTRST